MRGLLILLICLLTMYAPTELSLVIARWGLAPQFVLELAFMWLLYILALFIISVIVQKYIKELRS